MLHPRLSVAIVAETSGWGKIPKSLSQRYLRMPRPLGLLRLMPFMLLVEERQQDQRDCDHCVWTMSRTLHHCHRSKDRALSCTPLSPLPSGTTSGSRISSPKRTIHETTVQPVRHVTSTVGKSCAAGKCVTLRAFHALEKIALTCFDII